jgi:hypothetical protein
LLSPPPDVKELDGIPEVEIRAGFLVFLIVKFRGSPEPMNV